LEQLKDTEQKIMLLLQLI